MSKNDKKIGLSEDNLENVSGGKVLFKRNSSGARVQENISRDFENKQEAKAFQAALNKFINEWKYNSDNSGVPQISAEDADKMVGI